MATSTPIRPVMRPAGGLGQDLRAIRVVWKREMLRFVDDRIRIISSLMQPVLLLYVLGTGLSTLTSGQTGGVDLRTFMFPGILTTSVVFTAIFSAASIVWDREFGFLREMLVAPVSRASILIGKALGGATVATLQSMIIIALAPTVGVSYDAGMIATLIVEMFLFAFSLTALGLVIAARVKRMQSMMAVMQMLLVPLSFLSGSMYPIGGLPLWLKTLTFLNPITYAVHTVRTTVFAHIEDAPQQALDALNAPITWFGQPIGAWLSMAIVVAIGGVLLAIAVIQFNRAE